MLTQKRWLLLIYCSTILLNAFLAATVAAEMVRTDRSKDNAPPMQTEPDGRYAEIVKRLKSFINQELEQKQLPAVSIAVVDGDNVVWSAGFGSAGARAASADTVYRVGSVSKLFTDVAVMQLVDQGKLDLDVDVRRYLPNFRPRNPFEKPITLRQLMSHQSGLVRESPVGSYFHPNQPSLEDTVTSLNDTALTCEPGSRTRYSNAAVATAGYVVEKVAGKPFEEHLRDAILDPLEMHSSDFVRAQRSRNNWPQHGCGPKAGIASKHPASNLERCQPETCTPAWTIARTS